jgi:hypothetical protein
MEFLKGTDRRVPPRFEIRNIKNENLFRRVPSRIALGFSVPATENRDTSASSRLGEELT